MMAAATVKGFVNDIERLCECTICFVSYDEIKHIPRLLPCQHTMCTECLSKHCKGQKLRCPYCMKEHHVKNEDVSIFTKDNTRRHLKDLFEKFSQSLCGLCRRHDNAKYFCRTCSIRMCRGCYKERKQNVCSMHDFETPEDSSMTSDTSIDSAEIYTKDICLLPSHENNELKYFCSETFCSKPVCANCVAESHSKHDYKSIKDEYEFRKQCMKDTCLATLAKISIAKKLLETVENHYFSLRESNKKGTENLVTEANRGIKYLNDFEEITKKNSMEKLQVKFRELDKKKEKLQTFIENATECCAISEEAVTGNHFLAFLSVEKPLREKLTCFQKTDIESPLGFLSKGEDFELNGPILKLRKRVDRMTRDDEGFPEEPILVLTESQSCTGISFNS